jgi:hypothetical protein
MDASMGGHTDIVQALLTNGADVNAQMNNGVTALMEAATNGHTVTAQALLKKGADVNAKDDTGTSPLMSAAFYGHVETAQALLAAGADVNARNNWGKTALALAQQPPMSPQAIRYRAYKSGMTESVYEAQQRDLERGRAEIAQLLKSAGAKGE